MSRFDEDGFQLYLSAIQQFETLDRETELALARRWLASNDLAAVHRLVCAHLRFVVKIANGYRGYGLKVADLVEEGNVGLLEAAKRFDPDRNLRFMTYAAYWIRAYILAHVLKQWSLVSVGTGPLQSKLFFRLTRERSRITTVLGANAPEVEERLAEHFGTTPEHIRAMSSRLDAKDQSLDAAVYRESDTSAMELLTDELQEGQEERCARLERDGMVRDRVSVVMRNLNERERYIVERRLLTDEAETLAEIGRELRLSRERVRQLEERLKVKLRHALKDLQPHNQSAHA